MADTIIAMPKAGNNAGVTVPIKGVDIGGGNYALALSTGTASGICVAMPLYGSGSGAVVPIATVDLGDGTHALKATE